MDICINCGGDTSLQEVYLGSFDNVPEKMEVCEECDHSEMFCCDMCERMIVQSCGLNYQHRILECSIYCLRCYEEMIFEQGVRALHPDMEALHGMFHNSEELIEAGYTKIRSIFVQTENDAKIVIDEIRASDARYIINLESLSILGNEGACSLWIK